MLFRSAVDWSDLHLVSRRGHLLQLAGPAAAIHRLDDAGLAHLMAMLPTQHAAEVLAQVAPQRAADTLRASHTEVGTRVALALDEAAATPVIEALTPPQAHHVRALRRDRTVRRRFQRLRGWRWFRPPGDRHRADREPRFLAEAEPPGSPPGTQR